MRLSPVTGRGLMGVGSTVLSIDGVVPPSLTGVPSGGWAWLGDDLVGGQAFIGGLWHLKQLIVSSDTLSDLDAVTSASDVAQQFRAGNANWARFTAVGGIHTSAGLGLTLPTSGLADIDALGRLVVVQNYLADSGIVSYAANGSTLATVSAHVIDGVDRMRSRDGTIAYQETATAWHLRSVADGTLQSFAPRTDETIAATVPVLISGVMWVVELSSTKLTLRPATSSNGFVLATDPNLFNPDAVSLSAGTVRVGWSTTTGEGRLNLRLADVTVASGDFTSGSTSGGSLVLTPEAPIPPSNVPVGPVEGGSALGRKQPRHAGKREAWNGTGGLETYQRWWDQIANQAFSPANLSQATGTIAPAQGGTGTTTGLTVVDGANVIQNTTQLDTAQSFGPFVLQTGRNLVLAAPLTINQYIQLNGTAVLRVV